MTAYRGRSVRQHGASRRLFKSSRGVQTVAGPALCTSEASASASALAAASGRGFSKIANSRSGRRGESALGPEHAQALDDCAERQRRDGKAGEGGGAYAGQAWAGVDDLPDDLAATERIEGGFA